MIGEHLVSRTSAKAIADVMDERATQLAKGFTAEHDDRHILGEIGLAAALYALPYDTEIAGEPLIPQDYVIPLHMALELSCDWSLKPEIHKRRRLVKAAALLLAEIERLDRRTARQAG